MTSTGCRLLNQWSGFLKQANHDVDLTALHCMSQNMQQESSLQQKIADLVSSLMISAVMLLLEFESDQDVKGIGKSVDVN